jgi:transcriptional regulator with XRE-family HTH domain
MVLPHEKGAGIMTYSEVISKRILDLCKERNITVNKLATLSGMKQSTLENIIRGNTKSPGLRTLHRISQGLGINLSELLDFPEINELQMEDE